MQSNLILLLDSTCFMLTAPDKRTTALRPLYRPVDSMILFSPVDSIEPVIWVIPGEGTVVGWTVVLPRVTNIPYLPS